MFLDDIKFNIKQHHSNVNSCKIKYSFKPRNPVPNDLACQMYERTINAYGIWVRKSKGKKILGTSMNRLAIHHREMDCGDMNFKVVVHDTIKIRTFTMQ
jgi:hypothetical protein